MQTRSRVFDDLAKVANGAVSTLVGIKGEIEALVRQQIERFLLDADMVPRDEFDAVKAMAATARSEQEKLERRVRDLEARLGIRAAGTSPGTRASKTRGKPKSGAKAANKPARAAAKSKPAKTAKKPKARRRGRTGAKGKAAKG